MIKVPLCALVVFLTTQVLASPAQTPLRDIVSENETATSAAPRKLHGRFLHITDMHPDPHYSFHASTSKSCHGKKAKKKRKRAGYWGTPDVECDSPLRLIDLTLDYLDKNWADEIDFVVWTGDNARHDEDHHIPRTLDEILDQNKRMAMKMEKIFSKKGIPVVPSLGNNDIWQQNILAPGPNKITNEFASLWSPFIPFPQRQVFQRGAYYSTEVIPGHLAVISLNTLYFYDSNKAVGGCQYGDDDDPGNLEFDWLEVQLKQFRDKNIQVMITGHIPPSLGNYYPECYVRYTEMSLRFQDTILGHLYGHMNLDYFSFMEEIDLEIIPGEEEEGPRAKGGRNGLYETLLREFEQLPEESEEERLDGLAVINVAPSVVPNPFVPAFRIFSYNVSGDGLMGARKQREHGHRRGRKGNKDDVCKDKRYDKSWKCHLQKSWHTDRDAPSRRNQALTPLGYAQYYMPDIATANKTQAPRYELEYVTYPVSALGSGDWEPVPVRHLPRALREGRKGKRYAPYGLRDLTVGSWVGLGRRLGQGAEKRVRRRFREYMGVSG
ncbi:hypothetical protein AGABI1DRAFT_120307 [Agaricus bisporus var. burnettii JB137-S8]|uniref:Calcineurin-like phosphoesterase domain-containing protein n=1 Tax=Agaricus bisporus var. burnettii (strain JB137-S8 / ATCC MYA-4627 / FGSC 10392) TaxID=597362 RepID=K5XY65_AGABU|nr:uncharacterized protein AGABI1DRAFT_120307 [Agaricus bisporus var. burnettii JB137-S8]EKM80275.1 hypothetical protein AGABI1DRAFT_120307 [Agaricus bisporus var. burnettii JB137-S8]